MKEKLEAFLRDLQDVCIKHGATIIPEGSSDGGCLLQLEGIEEDIELGTIGESEAWCWPESWVKPLTVDR